MTDKIGAPPCGIYYRIKAVADKNAMGDNLRKMRQMNMAINQSSGYERNNQMIEITLAEPAARDAVGLAVQIIQHEGAIAIIKDEIGLAGELKADGVFIEEGIKHAREALGDAAIIGTTSSIEQGADYLITSTDLKDIAGNPDMTIVARGKGLTNENIGVIAQAGADYIDVTNYINSNKDGAMKAAVNILYALELALKPASSH